MDKTPRRRPGFLLGLADFLTAGLFFVVYMKRGLQAEIDAVLGRKTRSYWIVWLLGVPDLFLYPLVWMGRIAEDLKDRAVSLGIPGPHTSMRHMVLWNTLGLPFFGPMIATARFFGTLDRVEEALGRERP